MTPRPRVPVRAQVLRLLFGMLYRNRILYWFASTIPSAGQWRAWQRLALPRLVGRDVLEVGCGTGTLLNDVVAAGYRCSAIDRSPQMVAATRAHLARHDVSEREAPVILASVTRIPYPDESFDSVISTFPTEYIYDPAALREIGRVLRPGGRYIVVLSAALLPTRAALWPFVAVQRLVYGPGALASADSARGQNCAAMQQAQASIPTQAGGLVAHAECPRGPFWQAYLLLADKPRSSAL